MDEQELKTVEAMATYGGSFEKALSYCFLVADDENFRKLLKAFPEEWKKFGEMATATEEVP